MACCGASTCSTACCRRASPARGGAGNWGGCINLRNAQYVDDPRRWTWPVTVCLRPLQRAYIRHLVKADEILASILLTTLASTSLRLMDDLRKAIQGTVGEYE